MKSVPEGSFPVTPQFSHRPFPFCCSPGTCTDQCLCTQMPGELILPLSSISLTWVYLLSYHYFSLYPILLFFFIIFNFFKIFLECQLWRKWSLLPPVLFRNHVEPKICMICSSAAWEMESSWAFLWKAGKKVKFKALTPFSIIYVRYLLWFFFF